MCCFFYHSCKTKVLIYQSTDFTRIKRKHSVKYEAHFSNAIHTSHLPVKSLKGFKHWLLHCFLLFCGFFYSTTESTCSRCLSFRLCCFKKPKMKNKLQLMLPVVEFFVLPFCVYVVVGSVSMKNGLPKLSKNNNVVKPF